MKDLDGRPAPQPLRSDDFPLGLPHLAGKELHRVLAANAIYRYCAEKAKQYNDKCGWYIENPGNSIMWMIPFHGRIDELAWSF